MAVQDIFKGGFRKSIGVVTGSKLRGSYVAKTKPQPSNPDTIAQQKARGSFRSYVKFFAPFADFARRFVRVEKKGLSAYNQLVSNNRDRDSFSSTKDIKKVLRLTSGTLPGVIFIKNGIPLDFNDPVVSFENAHVDVPVILDGASTMATFTIESDSVLYNAGLPVQDLELHLFIVQCVTEIDPVITNCTMSDVFECNTSAISIIENIKSKSSGKFSVQFPIYSVCARFHCFAFAFFSARLAGRQLVSNSIIIYPKINVSSGGVYLNQWNYSARCIELMRSSGYSNIKMPTFPVVNDQFNSAMQFVFSQELKGEYYPAGSTFDYHLTIECPVTSPVVSDYLGFSNAVNTFDGSEFFLSTEAIRYNGTPYCENIAVPCFIYTGSAAMFLEDVSFYNEETLKIFVTGAAGIDKALLSQMIAIYNVDNDGLYTDLISDISIDRYLCSVSEIEFDEDGECEDYLNVRLSNLIKYNKKRLGVEFSGFAAYESNGSYFLSNTIYYNLDCYFIDNDLIYSMLAAFCNMYGVSDYNFYAGAYYGWWHRNDGRVFAVSKDLENTFQVGSAPYIDLYFCDQNGAMLPISDVPVFTDITITKTSDRSWRIVTPIFYFNNVGGYIDEDRGNGYLIIASVGVYGFNNTSALTFYDVTTCLWRQYNDYGDNVLYIERSNTTGTVTGFRANIITSKYEFENVKYFTLMFRVTDLNGSEYSRLLPLSFHVVN